MPASPRKNGRHLDTANRGREGDPGDGPAAAHSRPGRGGWTGRRRAARRSQGTLPARNAGSARRQSRGRGPARRCTRALARARPQDLQNYVLRLRRALNAWDATTIVTRPPGYALDVAETDVALSESSIDQGRRAAERGEHAAAVGRLDEALALGRGRPSPSPATSRSPTGTRRARGLSRYAVSAVCGRRDGSAVRRQRCCLATSRRERAGPDRLPRASRAGAGRRRRHNDCVEASIGA